MWKRETPQPWVGEAKRRACPGIVRVDPHILNKVIENSLKGNWLKREPVSDDFTQSSTGSGASCVARIELLPAERIRGFTLMLMMRHGVRHRRAWLRLDRSDGAAVMCVTRHQQCGEKRHQKHNDAHRKMCEVGSEREALAGACVEDSVLDVVAGEPRPEEQHGTVEKREQERAQRKRLEHREHAQKHR